MIVSNWDNFTEERVPELQRTQKRIYKDECEPFKQRVLSLWMWVLRYYGGKTPSAFDINSNFPYYYHCRPHSYISCHRCLERVCYDRRQNEVTAEKSQVEYWTLLTSFNRLRCGDPCTALFHRADYNSLTWWHFQCNVHVASSYKCPIRRQCLLLHTPHGFD